jgi:hypothetical protein
MPQPNHPYLDPLPEGSDECDDCDGRGYYFINGEPQPCICSEPQTDEDPQPPLAETHPTKVWRAICAMLLRACDRADREVR